MHLLSGYTLTPCWKCGSENVGGSSLYVIKFGMNPHRDTRTGDDAMTTLE